MTGKKRFDYRQYRSKSITVSRLDKIADIVLESGSGKIAAIIAAVKLALVLSYLIARKILVDQELLISKQKYEQDTSNDDRDELDDEDLDGS